MQNQSRDKYIYYIYSNLQVKKLERKKNLPREKINSTVKKDVVGWDFISFNSNQRSRHLILQSKCFYSVSKLRYVFVGA